LSRVFNFVRRLRLAHARYGRPYPALLAEFMELRGHQGYTPKEIFQCDLLNRQPMEEKRQTTLSKNTMVSLQQQLNPQAASLLVEDKSLFYPYCRDRGLPIPRLLALWGPEGGGTADGVPLRNDSDWTAFFSSLDQDEVVIKPSLGVYGRGVRFLRRNGDNWRDHDGRRLAAGDIVRELRQDTAFDRFVVQERVMPHAGFVELSGTDYLQTLRVITGIRGDADVRVLCAEQKIICGRAAISNFAWGTLGNAVSNVELKTGTLSDVIMARADGVGMDPIDRHPVTGRAFAGFVLPFWQESCALCKRAALEFLPLRTVGWDVAVTAHGPVLIEGNAWWDPHIHARSMGAFLGYAGSMLGKA
jgi:hypothetical protein